MYHEVINTDAKCLYVDRSIIADILYANAMSPNQSSFLEVHNHRACHYTS